MARINDYYVEASRKDGSIFLETRVSSESLKGAFHAAVDAAFAEDAKDAGTLRDAVFSISVWRRAGHGEYHG